jgi:uncharacterized protein YndB with AHSA1/START domain
MHYFEAESSIEATPSEVWAVLTDSAAWPNWDSGVVAVEGSIQPGEKLTIRSQVAPERGFPVKVTELDEPQAMTFTGGMPLGLFKGVRRYTLTPNGNGSTHFTMREEYTGAMLGLIWKSIPDLSGSFTQFAEGLKRQVENAG